MFTANTMNCLTEVMGLGLPGNGTVAAISAKRLSLATQAGERVVQVLAENLRPRDIVTYDAFCNAFTVDMALGGSTNTVLHLKAVAHEGGIDFPLKVIDEISRRTPYLCKLRPGGPYFIEDLDRAGGIPAVMKEVRGMLKLNLKTVTGKTVGDNIASAHTLDKDVIRPLSNAHSPTGGLAILFGSLAPEGSVVKSAAVPPEMMVHRGPARVFDCEEDATKAIMDGLIKRGDVIVVRYEGPKGGPGMREMLQATGLLGGMGMDKEVALVTDGRYSGGSKGAAIGHVSPEAACRGPIAALKDGDIISIDIPKGKLDVELTQDAIEGRLSKLGKFEIKVKSGYLKRYAERVTSASNGAVLNG
jgi:dihydroxy-acid dehydratase